MVIDVGSGDHEIAEDEEQAFARAEHRHLGALFFFSGVGPDGSPRLAHRIGAGAPSGTPNGAS